MKDEQKKNADSPTPLYDFGVYFLVTCPQCQKMAQVLPRITYPDCLTKERTLTCTGCGYVKTTIPNGSVTLYLDRDWFFQQPLWLQIQICGNRLWAYNPEHLQAIKAYVQANLRTRAKDKDYGWKNRSLTSRLPKWIKSKKNREEIIKGIHALEHKCESL